MGHAIMIQCVGMKICNGVKLASVERSLKSATASFLALEQLGTSTIISSALQVPSQGLKHNVVLETTIWVL